MNAKQLKELLATVDDNTVILAPGSDHSYYKAEVSVTTAVAYPDGRGRAHYAEDFGPGSNDSGGKVVPALIIK